LSQITPLPELIAEPTGARSMSFVGTHEYLAPEIIKGRYTIIKPCSCVLFSVLMKDEVKQTNFSFSIQCNNGRFVAPLD